MDAPLPPHPSRWGRFLRGVRYGFPILLGYIPIGAAFGILATTIGFTKVQAVLCSALALAGAGQFIALSLLASGEGVAGVLAATAVVNLRYVLFGATLSPFLRRYHLSRQATLAATVTDETFAFNVTDLENGTADPSSMAGVGAVSWAGWVGGTVLGATAAGVIGDPTRWGVEFAMAAMFTALLIDQAKDRRHVILAVVAGLLALAFSSLLPGKWFVIAASILAAAIGAALWR
jgi:4-azaleucine resistance transporter AzlC